MVGKGAFDPIYLIGRCVEGIEVGWCRVCLKWFVWLVWSSSCVGSPSVSDAMLAPCVSFVLLGGPSIPNISLGEPLKGSKSVGAALDFGDSPGLPRSFSRAGSPPVSGAMLPSVDYFISLEFPLPRTAWGLSRIRRSPWINRLDLVNTFSGISPNCLCIVSMRQDITRGRICVPIRSSNRTAYCDRLNWLNGWILARFFSGSSNRCCSPAEDCCWSLLDRMPTE